MTYMNNPQISSIAKDAIATVFTKASTQVDQDMLISKLKTAGIEYAKLPALAKARIAGMRDVRIRKKSGGFYKYYGIGLLLGRKASGAKLLCMKNGENQKSITYGKDDDFLPEFLLEENPVIITDDILLSFRLLSENIHVICIGKSPRYLIEKIDALMNSGRIVPMMVIALKDPVSSDKLTKALSYRQQPYMDIQEAKDSDFIPGKALDMISNDIPANRKTDVTDMTPDLFASVA